MSITNYGELKTAVANWLHRSTLTARIPEFILEAESLIAGDPDPKEPDALPGVRCRNQFIRATAEIEDEYFDQPTNSLGIEDIQLNTSPVRSLEYMSPKMITKKLPSNSIGTPSYYTIIGDEVQVRPIPSGLFTCEVAYYKKFDALSGDTDTNWLLTNHPMIYLYGALIAATPYLKNNEETLIWVSKYRGMVNALNEAEKRALQGGQLVSRISGAVR